MTAPISEHRFESATALADELAGQVAAEVREAVATRGSASLVLSGGRTPLPFFAALKEQALPWNRIWVTLADDRWVPPDSPDSNERVVREQLLTGPAKAARFVPLKNLSATPQAGLAETAAALVAIPRPFDVVILGMGDDGHTASLFPQAPQLAAALDRNSDAVCAAIDPITAPHLRMTLTLAQLLASRRIIVHISGEAKWRVYQQTRQNGPVEEMPIRAVLRQQEVPVNVYWSP